MPACPDDRAELAPKGSGLACARCGGVWISLDDVGELAKGATPALFAPEGNPSAPPYKKPRACPECAAVLAPWRIAKMEAWADRCASCERAWLERQDLRTLELAARQRAFQGAYQSFTPEERRTMAHELAAEALPPEGAPISPLHRGLAMLGLPVVRRTEGGASPLATWLLALGLVAIFALSGEDQPQRLGLHPAAMALGDAVTANFVHFGAWHLLGNLYFLFAFGDGVEQRWGWPGLLGLFVVGGTAALWLDALAEPDTTVIAGASGGIAALMGACLVLQRRAQVLVFLAGRMVAIPIWGYVAFELAYQLAMAAMGVPGVAWLAHAAGMVIGFAAALGLQRVVRAPR